MSEQTTTQCKVLYHEVIGAGDDCEANDENGIAVILSVWDTDIWELHYLAHYLFEIRVMVGREIVKDECLIFHHRSRLTKYDTKYIREAVATVDKLKKEFFLGKEEIN
jgi:anaerobic selenocysteine-containing dehydrogenase